MWYDYVCDECGDAKTISRRMSDPIDDVVCNPPCEAIMRRLYSGQQRSIVGLDMTGYIEKAYRGEELPAGMTRSQVRAIVDSQTKVNKRGRANARVYKTLR